MTSSTFALGLDATSIFPRQSAGIEHLVYGVIPYLLDALGPSHFAVGIPHGTRDEYLAWCRTTGNIFIEVGPPRPPHHNFPEVQSSGRLAALQGLVAQGLAPARRVRSIIAAIDKSRQFNNAFPSDVVLYPFHRVPALAPTSVIILHDLRAFTPLAQGGAWIDRRIISWNVRRARRLITSWPHPRTHAATLFGPSASAKLEVVPFPPTPHSASAPSVTPNNTASTCMRLLYSASTVQHKNHAMLIEAIAIARDQFDMDVELDLPGPLVAPHCHALRAQIHDLGLEGRVRLLGFVSAERMSDLYARCDVVAIPSLWEAASGALFDAVAYGKPLLCADVEPLREQLALIGIDLDLVPPDDPRAWAERLRTMVGGRPGGLPANYDTNCGHLFLSGLSWQRTAAEYLRICQDAVKRSSCKS